MLIILSPSKTLDTETLSTVKEFTQPVLLNETESLVKAMKSYSAEAIAELMEVSGKIAALNAERYRQFSLPFTAKNAKQAILMFKGDVYEGLAAETLTAKELQFAQAHVRILSGLYGLLRPLDLMQAYRLEMGIKLPNARGKDLYQFWGGRITEQVNAALAEQGDSVLVNLASQEYFGAIQQKALSGTVITPVFKDYKAGAYKVIGLLAKRARGVMTRYMVHHRLKEPEELKEFSEEGYCFNPKMSNEREWVFTRKG